MSLGSINDILILNTFNEEMESLYKGVVSSNAFPRTIALIRQEFPNIADEEIVHLVNMLVLGNRQNKKETVELVVTLLRRLNCELNKQKMSCANCFTMRITQY